MKGERKSSTRTDWICIRLIIQQRIFGLDKRWSTVQWEGEKTSPRYILQRRTTCQAKQMTRKSERERERESEKKCLLLLYSSASRHNFTSIAFFLRACVCVCVCLCITIQWMRVYVISLIFPTCCCCFTVSFDRRNHGIIHVFISRRYLPCFRSVWSLHLWSFCRT